MAQVMLFTCTREENAVLAAMRSVSLNSSEKLNLFFSNLVSQTGASSAAEVVKQVLDGTSTFTDEVLKGVICFKEIELPEIVIIRDKAVQAPRAEEKFDVPANQQVAEVLEVWHV